jgi:tRNA(fMet)-specific endonuclease VapC
MIGIMRAILDTDILSEVLKAKDADVAAKASAYRADEGRYTFSTITVMEIVKGLSRKRREDAIKRFLAVVEVSDLLTLDKVSAELAGRVYADLEEAGRPIGVADVLIAAIAIHHGLPLVTGNISDYERIQAAGYPLVLENWRAPA